jgi:SAM-dependent methyltransferase
MKDIHEISTGLELGDDGIWYSPSSEIISYPSEGNEACFEVEDNSFWFKHRNNCIVSAVNSFPPKNPESRNTIFDIGGGNGFVSLGLSQAGYDVVLIEPGLTGSLNAKHRGLKNVICATTETAEFKPHTLPAVGLFDVVEHIEDDLAFLKSIYDLVEIGGYLYVTVPAYSLLWSNEDISAGHFRRYTLKGITEVIEESGFKVEFSSYIFRFLPFPTFLLRALPYLLGFSKGTNEKNISRSHATKSLIASRCLDLVLKPEIKNLINKKPMMFGGSCLIVAKHC